MRFFYLFNSMIESCCLLFTEPLFLQGSREMIKKEIYVLKERLIFFARNVLSQQAGLSFIFINHF